MLQAEELMVRKADVAEDVAQPQENATLEQELATIPDPTMDAVQSYLNEIGRVPLLSAIEEVELAEAIADEVQSKGGFMTVDDLAGFEVEWPEPLSTTYNGAEVFELGPNNQGQLALGDGLVVFAGLLQQFNTQVTNIAGITNQVQNSLTSAARVFEIERAGDRFEITMRLIELDSAGRAGTVESIRWESAG